VIDPIEVMEQYGTDALRFTLATSSTPGNDMKLVPERIVGNRNFANKIWNASRFVIGQTDGIAGGIPSVDMLAPRTLADRWIVSRAQRLTTEVTRLMEDYQFGEAGRQIYDFIWSEYCDWYLEIAKVQLRDEAQAQRTALILRAALDRALRLLHPFMPFVTEEVWQHLYADTSEDERPASALIVAQWPAASVSATRQQDNRAEADMALIQEIVIAIRNARNEAEVEAKRHIKVILAGGDKTTLLRQQAALIEQLARTEPLRIERRLAAKPEQAMALVAGGVEIYLPLAGLLDLAKEAERLDGEIVKAEAAVERSKKVLDNPNFVARAKPEIVQRERDALTMAEDTLARLRARRRELAG
jgi:valyl-tRNA synthetase